jgi:fucose permease
MSTIRQLYLFVSGCIVVLTTCVTLNFFGYYKVVLYFGSACAGICMSGIYPLTITVPNSYGMQASSKNTSQYILGSCIGFGATPYLVGLLMDQFGPDMLFVCEWVTALIMLILLFKVTLVGRKY